MVLRSSFCIVAALVFGGPFYADAGVGARGDGGMAAGPAYFGVSKNRSAVDVQAVSAASILVGFIQPDKEAVVLGKRRRTSSIEEAQPPVDVKKAPLAGKRLGAVGVQDRSDWVPAKLPTFEKCIGSVNGIRGLLGTKAPKGAYRDTLSRRAGVLCSSLKLLPKEGADIRKLLRKLHTLRVAPVKPDPTDFIRLKRQISWLADERLPAQLRARANGPIESQTPLKRVSKKSVSTR